MVRFKNRYFLTFGILEDNKIVKKTKIVQAENEVQAKEQICTEFNIPDLTEENKHSVYQVDELKNVGIIYINEIYNPNYDNKEGRMVF